MRQKGSIKHAIATTIVSDAPEFIPSNVGEASGLRVMLCSSQPATLIPEPIKIQAMMRGSLKLKTVILAIKISSDGNKDVSASIAPILIG